jgi:ribosomal protein S12 methylthiotransferase accessory factor YcaO
MPRWSTPVISRISSVAKHEPRSSERIVSASVTQARASHFARNLGLTRLADITGLDRLGIPVYSAVVPKSGDTISVYNGKGVTPLDARTGALMETIERQVAVRADLPLLRASIQELAVGRDAVADPRSFNHQLRETFSEQTPYLWTTAYDLISNETVYVPVAMAGFRPQYVQIDSPFVANSSNGLASGNCFEEAVCHALCELIERDAFTLADLRCQWIPRAMREAVFGAAAGTAGRDNVRSCPVIDLDDAGESVAELWRRFERAGLRPVVRDITSDLGICSVVASVSDDSVPGFPQAHCGFGAHPNARIAVTRALTELAQSRAADIQGAREDIVAAGDIPHSSDRHMQRIQKIEPRRWLLQTGGPARRFMDVISVENEDIAEDIHLILARLIRAGMRRVLVVEFNGPTEFSVVRVMVPGLEFWSLDGGAIGHRALDFWKRHARDIAGKS